MKRSQTPRQIITRQPIIQCQNASGDYFSLETMAAMKDVKRISRSQGFQNKSLNWVEPSHKRFERQMQEGIHRQHELLSLQQILRRKRIGNLQKIKKIFFNDDTTKCRRDSLALASTCLTNQQSILSHRSVLKSVEFVLDVSRITPSNTGSLEKSIKTPEKQPQNHTITTQFSQQMDTDAQKTLKPIKRFTERKPQPKTNLKLHVWDVTFSASKRRASVH